MATFESQKSKKTGDGEMPLGLLYAPVLWVLVLILVAMRFSHDHTVSLLGLTVPASALWFGAVGGLVLSLQGIFLHNHKWNDSYDIWLWFSPLMGVIYGVFAYLFLVTVAKTTTTAAPKPGDGSAIYGLAAFTLGYAQSKFHALITKIFSIIFQPSDPR